MPTPTPAPNFATTALVAAAQSSAESLAANPGATAAQIEGLMMQINQAYSSFQSEAGQLASPDQTEKALRTAYYFTLAADALAQAQNYPLSVQNRLEITAARLAQTRSLLPGGTPPGSLAHASGVATAPVIGSALVLNDADSSPVLSPGSVARITGDQSPLSNLSVANPQLSAAALPYELANASVTIGGRAARVFYVSPSRISFYVPAGLPAGDTEVIVTSQEGYVSRGVVTVAPLAPSLFAVGGAGVGSGLALNDATHATGSFDVTTNETLGADKRTRLQLFALGFDAAANTDTRNDVPMEGGAVMPNLAESVTVEARAGDGRVFLLPVEYAFAHAGMAGLDQVNCVLVPELRGAGAVDLTLLVGGRRSNSVRIVVR